MKSEDGAYFHEKLSTAVLILAASEGTLAKRLSAAYRDSLMRVMPDRQIPWEDVRERFIALLGDLAPNGQTDAALARWSETGDLRRLAVEVVELEAVVGRRLQA